MDAKDNKPTEQELSEAVSAEENYELGIKRVRTYAEDLALAKEKAGVRESEPKKKRGGFFGGKKKKSKVANIDKDKDLSNVQPKIAVPKAPKAEPEEGGQPSREFIEQELARSGIVTQHDAQEEVREETSVPTLRTYKYDTAETIEEKGASKISMLAAEQKRRVNKKDFSGTFSSPTQKETSLGRSATFIILSVILIVVGIWGGLHFYTKSKIDDTPAVEVSKNILFTNDTVERDARGISGRDFVNLISAGADSVNGRAGDLVEIELRDRGLLGEAKISIDTFFKKLEGGASGRLARSFGKDYVVGTHSGAENSIFYLFRVEDFDTSFAGMLEWEETMHFDLFGGFEGESFVDEFIQNKDTRVQRDRFGNTKLIYAFPNSETLIITQNEEAFFELFDRLTVSNATRN